MNNINLVGRLTKDPILRYSQPDDGEPKASAELNIAVKRPFNKDKTDFFRVMVWNGQAESIGKYLKKGSQCAVQGYLITGAYTDKNGINRYTTNVVASQIEFLSTPKEAVEENEREDLGDYNDGIPF